VLKGDVGDIKNLECYGLYVPLKNKGEGTWLKEDKVNSSYELEFGVLFTAEISHSSRISLNSEKMRNIQL
jgi:hypothetical protein